jgi:hypothetical protein
MTVTTKTAAATLSIVPMSQDEFAKHNAERSEANRVASKRKELADALAAAESYKKQADGASIVASAIRGLITTLEANESLADMTFAELETALRRVRESGQYQRNYQKEYEGTAKRIQASLDGAAPVTDDDAI